MRPLAAVGTAATPQIQPIPGRDMVKNAAGGYVFDKTTWTKVEDFMILGSDGGTYYTGQDYAGASKLTQANVDVLMAAIAEDGPRVVELAATVATATPPRAPKPDYYLFALAAAAAARDAPTRAAVKTVFADVVRTTDHLAKFFGYWKNQAGKPTARGTAPVIGRAMRTTFGSWFNAGDAVHDVAFKAVKARQRSTPTGEAMALRDVIRIAHPKGRTFEHSTLIGWLAGNVDDNDARRVVPDIEHFLTAQEVTAPAEAIEVISNLRVPWEFLPSAVLADPGVWAALAGTVGLTALLRNLAKMTRIGTLNPFSYEVNDLVVKRLTSPQSVARARIHPMDVYLALRTYQSGVSRPDRRQPPRTWNPVPVISDALETMYDHAFAAVEPTGKRLLVAVDSSGSMAYSRVIVGGSDLGRAYDVANTVAVTLARIEPRVHVINVDTQMHPSRVTRRTNLRELTIWHPSGGGTDMALPFSWALQRSRPFDGIVVITDNETWAGRSHPVQALDQYRRSVNRDARAIVVSMTATGYSIVGNDTPGVLQVAGLDGSLPTLIAGFIKRGRR